MTINEELSILNELLVNYRYIQEIEPHFANLRRIKELEEQISVYLRRT